ncbi:MAG: acyl-CoA thioesterase [Betaproteobacteria bacterium]
MTTKQATDWIHQLAPAETGDPSSRRLPARNELEFVELIVPQQANHYGTLFGPNALALLGKAAFLVAARFTRQAVVMAAARQVDFLTPIPVGSLLSLHARVTRVGRTSLSVQVVATFDAAPGTRPEEVLRAEFEMVTVDELGRPCPVAPPPPAQELAFAAPASA